MGRVLIVKFGAIGDVVMAIPAARALADRGATIEWVCGPGVAALLGCYPWIRVIVADDRVILKGGAAERAREISRLWRALAGQRYDLCATLYYDARYRVLTLPVRGRKISLSGDDRARKILPGRSHADELSRILLGEEDGCRDRSWAPVAPERLPVSPLRARTGARRVALVPGGARNMLRQQTLRRWPVGSYVAVAERLLGRGDEVVLVGGPEDGWVRGEFARVAGDRLIDAIGAMTLPEVVAAFSECDVVVSHDTGPLHLAGISRAAVVGLFGPTDPASFLPRRDGVRGLWGGEGFACRPCYDGRDFAPCRDNGCMRQVTVEMVMGQIAELIKDRTGGWRVVLPSTMGEAP